MSSQYELAEKQFSTLTSPNSAYSFNFSNNLISAPTNERWHNSHRSHRSEYTSSSSLHRSWEVQSFNSTVNDSTSTSQNTTKNPLRVVVGPHHSTLTAAPFSTDNSTSFASPSTSHASSPWWDKELSPPSPAMSAPYTFPSRFVKDEPQSPKFIIEPLLPSSLVTKRSSSSSPEPCSSPTQAELETQLLLSQALAPPTEVPLRATQACDDMRQMMRSFRLNPFSIFPSNGKDSKSDSSPGCDLDPVLTWCGDIAKPLDEVPLIFEWQLDDYRSGLEEELPQLIVMDDMEGPLDIAGPEDNDILQVTSREALESPMIISSSLLSSEAASQSGFSTPAETESQRAHVSPLSTFPRMSFHPEYSPKEVETKQRAGSYDSGYESNTSVLTSSLPIYACQGSFHSRSFDTGTLSDLPIYKKPRFSMHTDSNPSKSSTSTKSNHEASFRPTLFRDPSSLRSQNDKFLHTVRKFELEGSFNIPRPSRVSSPSYMVSMKNSQHDVANRRGSSGTMYIPTLLNADSANSSSSPYSTGYSFTRPPGAPFTRHIHSLPSESTISPLIPRSCHPTSSTQDVMNVRIWESATNPPLDSDSEMRRFDHRQQQQQHHTPTFSMLDTTVHPRMSPRMPGPVSALLPPLCYLGQQLGYSQTPEGRTQQLLSPLTDIVHTRLRTLSSDNGPGELYGNARGTEPFPSTLTGY
ncbi:hypothetical protein J3R30DRAFT_34258 [Lentinula aciculospora]|uniref:Uncharacterized protein n=1 Tax=Lentinula aciculospora TaxID=153920 RepID=A0A9W9AUY2_9AGAR|nr:hypothetical protein J3R30DRAFT_34258 [Lentinula aciculospora]